MITESQEKHWEKSQCFFIVNAEATAQNLIFCVACKSRNSEQKKIVKKYSM